MVQQVLMELDTIFEQNEKDSNVATSYGNSHMISSCLGLLNQYEVQTQILTPARESPTLLKKFMDQINAGLKHSNPQVRKEGEKLFKTLFILFGAKLEPMLVDQKPAIVNKLLQQAKQEVVQNQASSAMAHSTVPTKNVDSQETQDKQNAQRASN